MSNNPPKLVSSETSSHASKLGDTPAALGAALAAGRTARDLGEFQRAAEHFDVALTLAKELGDAQAEVDALNLQAGLASTSGDYSRALQFLERAFRLTRNHSMHERQANILNNLGTLHTLLSNYPQALEHLKAAHDLLRSLAPETKSYASNLISLGTLYEELGEAAEARVFFTQANKAAQDANEPLIAAAALNNLANADMNADNWYSAARRFQEALAITQTLGAKEQEIDNLDGLGQVYVALGDLGAAIATHLEVLQAARKIGYREGECDALLNLGRDYLATDQPAQAAEVLCEGLRLADQVQYQASVYKAHELLSTAYEQVDDLTQALHHHRAFRKAEKAIFNEENERQARKLALQFDLERARHETEEYRLRSEITQQARDEAETIVRERTRELEEAQLEIVTRLAVAAEYRDDDTGEHTRRVGRNAAAIAHALGWADDQVDLLFTAARLHDVGKIAVSDTILHKPGKLEPDEMALMKTHAVIGARILAGGHSPLLEMAEEIALAHHERWDGKGYPAGLSGEAIPPAARIVAVADVLDALTHERPYKRPWAISEALAEIKRQSGHHFDPKVVEGCLKVFGADDKLSPTDAPDDLRRNSQDAQREAAELKPSYRVTPVATRSVAQLEKLLAQKAQELEASKREAQAASRRMQDVAFTDLLTGLPNRRAFEADLEVAAARALHHGDYLSVLNLDLDMLKLVNDTHGHERGDALLRAFASSTSEHLQSRGKTYRVGGDEFAAILIHTSTGHFSVVQATLDKAMYEVRAAGFSNASVSAGLVAFPEEVRMVGDLIRLSDQRMYEDKLRKRETGRSEARYGEPNFIA